MTKEYSDYLAHYGVEGQKKGVRRWQNEDGSYTDAGKEHYGFGQGISRSEKRQAKVYERYRNARAASREFDKASKLQDQSDELYDKARQQYKELGRNRSERMKAVGSGSEKAKEYEKTWNDSEFLSNQAYEHEVKAKALYKKTGRTTLSRIRTMRKVNSANTDELLRKMRRM